MGKRRKAATRVTRFPRERHPFPGRSAPTSTRAPRRLRSCGSPARTSPPARGRASGQWANRRGRAAERDKCHYLKKKKNAINATRGPSRCPRATKSEALAQSTPLSPGSLALFSLCHSRKYSNTLIGNYNVKQNQFIKLTLEPRTMNPEDFNEVFGRVI